MQEIMNINCCQQMKKMKQLHKFVEVLTDWLEQRGFIPGRDSRENIINVMFTASPDPVLCLDIRQVLGLSSIPSTVPWFHVL
jgi:hypothetical protein